VSRMLLVCMRVRLCKVTVTLGCLRHSVFRNIRAARSGACTHAFPPGNGMQPVKAGDGIFPCTVGVFLLTKGPQGSFFDTHTSAAMLAIALVGLLAALAASAEPCGQSCDFADVLSARVKELQIELQKIQDSAQESECVGVAVLCVCVCECVCGV
jgi:hypothetical protein